ncbi:MMACHC [Mytilus edulis]|uniref:Cyanocobalamin reductase (cyanide-eliminating) n=1 Tax=Mytilus edulis TaxID=6550 RepID=A0A8S3QBC1_MYTED|nr:MMACHC [Mytilus edulis]
MDIYELNKLTESISKELECTGFEVKPFKIGWYNDKVDKRFILPETYDTIGYLIISTPSMFENAFLPFISRQECTGVKDPLDQCVAHYFQQIKQKFPDYDIESIHDYELHPNHRPKVLIHGTQKKKMCGVCIHPQYGGWFALRGVLIFKNIECPSLIQEKPIDVIATREKRIELLEKFNYCWQDWTYRDLTETVEKYSDDQKQYFATLPKDRKELILSLKSKIKLQSEEIRGS